MPTIIYLYILHISRGGEIPGGKEMATIREMREVVDSVIVYDTVPFEELETAYLVYSKVIKDALRDALYSAEDKDLCYNYEYRGQPCTFWVVGGYEVTYITDDGDFTAEQLSYDDMDDLIIEEV